MDYYFTDLPYYGELELYDSFIDYDGNELLFLCVDKALSPFLCVQHQLSAVRKWYAVKTSFTILSDLIHKKITIQDAFLSSVNEQAPLVHIVKDSKSEDTAQIVKVDEIYVKNTLSKEDTFFFGEVEPAIEILRDFQNESRVFE